MTAEDTGREPSRGERREERQRRERERMAKHGAGLRRVYRDAVLKRLGGGNARRRRKPRRR